MQRIQLLSTLLLPYFLLLPTTLSQTSAQGKDAARPASGNPLPVAMTECEGVNNCASWTFLGTQGNGQWPTGEVANLSVERYDTNTVIIRRADSTGSAAGLTATYTGTRHGDRVGGDFSSSWPGHWDNKTGNWYASVGSPISPPSIMHFCGSNCGTLKLEGGHYVGVTDNGFQPPDFSSVWTIESFARESVILRRHDSPSAANPHSQPNGWDTVYTAKISSDGNSLVDINQDGHPNPKMRMAWGDALASVPGSNAERDGLSHTSQPQPRPSVVIAPVVCVPWFFTMVCG